MLENRTAELALKSAEPVDAAVDLSKHLDPQFTSKPALATQVGGAHYKDLKIQPAEYVHANRLPYLEGSVVYYVTRWRDKGGLADLRKAKHTLDILIELEQRVTTRDLR